MHRYVKTLDEDTRSSLSEGYEAAFHFIQYINTNIHTLYKYNSKFTLSFNRVLMN